MLFWELWESLTVPIKNHRIDFRKLSCLSACKKSTSSVTSFLRCCKEIANLGIPGRTHLKEKYQFERLLMFTSRKKNQLHPSRFPWDIAKILKHCYFGYFENAWLRTTKVILSICRKPLCLSAGKKSTSFPVFFRRYCKDM